MTIFNRSLRHLILHVVTLLIVTILARCFKRLGGGILLGAVMGLYWAVIIRILFIGSQITERAGLNVVLCHYLVGLLPDV